MTLRNVLVLVWQPSHVSVVSVCAAGFACALNELPGKWQVEQAAMVVEWSNCADAAKADVEWQSEQISPAGTWVAGLN